MESDSALPSVIEISSGSIMEITSGSAPTLPLEPEPEEIDGVQKMIQDQLREAWSQGVWKWTWGVDLTDEDITTLVRGADQDYGLPHSGYDLACSEAL
jgi:hypothetical protein